MGKLYLAVFYVDITVTRRTAFRSGYAAGVKNMNSAGLTVNESIDRQMSMTEQRKFASIFYCFFDKFIISVFNQKSVSVAGKYSDAFKCKTFGFICGI